MLLDRWDLNAKLSGNLSPLLSFFYKVSLSFVFSEQIAISNKSYISVNIKIKRKRSGRFAFFGYLCFL